VPQDAQPDAQPISRRRELLLFLFLTVVLAPMLAVAIVGGFGFMVWIWQIFAGPPTGA
jgi:periplasmic nitrate reductase NapE